MGTPMSIKCCFAHGVSLGMCTCNRDSNAGFRDQAQPGMHTVHTQRFEASAGGAIRAHLSQGDMRRRRRGEVGGGRWHPESEGEPTSFVAGETLAPQMVTPGCRLESLKRMAEPTSKGSGFKVQAYLEGV